MKRDEMILTAEEVADCVVRGKGVFGTGFIKILPDSIRYGYGYYGLVSVEKLPDARYKVVFLTGTSCD